MNVGVKGSTPESSIEDIFSGTLNIGWMQLGRLETLSMLFTGTSFWANFVQQELRRQKEICQWKSQIYQLFI